MTIRLLRCLIGIACGAFLIPAGAQNWPAKPVHIIVPVSTGEARDSVARLLADSLSRSLSRSFVVDNISGGGGMAASQTTAHAAPDGYTFYFADVGVVATDRLLFKSLPYDPERDFVAVAILYDEAPYALAVAPELPVRSIADLITLAKSRPGKLSYGTGTVGVQVMPGLWLKKVTGIDIVAVPYKLIAQMLQDTAAGRIELSISSVGGMVALHKAGKIRVIAVTSAKRVPLLPEVPAIAETLPGYRVSGLGVLLAPTGTPPEIVQRMNRETGTATKNPDYVQRLNSYGYGVPTTIDGAGTPQQIADPIRNERDSWSTMLKGVNFEPM